MFPWQRYDDDNHTSAYDDYTGAYDDYTGAYDQDDEPTNNGTNNGTNKIEES